MSKIFIQKIFSSLLLKSIAWVLMLLPAAGFSQFYNGYQMEFGRSRVQFDEFFWTFYKFDRFDTYFYLNGKELAVHASEYADQQLLKYEDELDTYLEGKIQFIIFNNLNDLKQSNIGLSSNAEYNIGGISHILGNKVVLYFDGSMVNFELQIRQGIAHILLQNAIFGSNIGSQVMNSFLRNFPEWYTVGLISYLAEDWNTQLDNRIKNVIASGKYKKFNRLVMDQSMVKIAGHSFWRFIAETYGKSNIVNVVNMTRVSRSVETGFMYVLGLSLETLYEEWLAYYSDENDAEQQISVMPANGLTIDGKRVMKRNDKDRKYSEFQISPDGEYATFVTNETGKYKVWIHNMNSGKIKKLFTGGYKLEEKIDYSYPILTWHPSGEVLTMVTEKKGLIWIYFYNVDDRKWTHQNIFGFDKIVDLSYSNDGRSLLFSGVQKGQNDIFLFSISSGSYETITNDIYDDLNPRFLQGTNKIIFSSNRTSDTLLFGDNRLPEHLNQYYDIFIYDYGTRNPVLRRVTNTPVANEIQPQSYDQGHFIYLSDGNGIFNAYIGKLDSSVSFVDTAVHYRYFTRSFPVTNYQRSINEIHISARAGYKTWVMNENLYDRMFIEDLYLVENLEPTDPQNTSYMNKLLGSVIKVNSVGIPSPVENNQREPDEVSGQTGQRKSFRNVMRNDTYNIDPGTIESDSSGLINIDNYQIGNQGIIKINMPDNVNAMKDRFSKTKEKDAFIIPKRQNYLTQYSISELVTQIDFSYLNQMYQPFSQSVTPSNSGNIPGFDIKPNYSSPGLSPTFKVGITDLMEDYRIMGGVRIGLDLVNKEYFVNYSNLKKRMDKEFVFQRRSLEEPIISVYVTRQKINEGFFILTYPLNRVLRVKGSFLFRNENYIFAGPDEFVISYPNEILNWGGAKLQLIYDDTKVLGLNLHEGSRFMVFAEYNQLVEQIDRNLIVAGFDFRNYTRIHRQFIWANRIAGSTNFGSERLIYYMGGTDNWMGSSFDQDTRIDPDQNWVYQALATNMRGFNQNIRNGNNFLVINSEFRLPVFRYLLNKPIQSEFIKNFQVVAFGDLGTAWTGWNPYDKDNVLYTRYEESGPLRIKIQYEKDPIIGGVGFGARTKLLGYFIKGDLAWGIEDGKIKKTPKFYISMSLDF